MVEVLLAFNVVVLQRAMVAPSHKLPGTHQLSVCESGRKRKAVRGLISYGPDTLDGYRRVASYIDRVLKGEKSADLPVQAPTKYELVINLRTAKSLGVNIRPTRHCRRGDRIGWHLLDKEQRTECRADMTDLQKTT
jgi:hypothetical protein